MLTSTPFESRFHDAVAAVDIGDLSRLRHLLATTPDLAGTRLEEPGPWLLDSFGGTIPDFFRRPYLLWFAAEDPVRNGTLPANIADAARLVIDVARQHAPETVQEQVDYGLRLVAWSWIARKAGVQVDLIDVMLDAGASPDGRPDDALVNRNIDAAAHLIARGAPITLGAAACLDRWHDVSRFGPLASAAERQCAFVLAALNGNARALTALLAIGADVNAHSARLFSHASPLHHAVSSGSLDAVTVLLDAGADLGAVDTAWAGTPLGWARHYCEDGSSDDRSPGARAAIVEFLVARHAG